MSTTPGSTKHSHDAMPPTLMSERQLASLLQVSTAWCQRARRRGNGPPFVRINRTVRYLYSAVHEWLHGLPSHLATSDNEEQPNEGR